MASPSKFGDAVPAEEPSHSKFGAASAVSAQPDTPSAASRFGSALWEGIGGQALQDLVGGASRDPARAKKAMETFKGLVHGIADESGRVWGQLSRTGEAITKGDVSGAAYHLAGSVPLVGAGAQQVAKDVDKGDYAAATGHGIALVAPFAAPAVAEGVGRVADSAPVAATVAAAKAAAPKAAGALGMAAGAEAVGQIPGAAWPARAAIVIPAGRMLRDAGREGLAAGRRVMAERAPVELPPGGAFPEGYQPAAAPTVQPEAPPGGHFPEGYQPVSAPPATATPVDPLSPAHQDIVRGLAERIQGQGAPAAAPRTPIGPPTATTPVVEPSTPVAPTQPVSVSPEVYKGGAREVRADRAATLGEAFRNAGIPASDLDAMAPEQWEAVARAHDFAWPKTKEAQAKLIRDTKASIGGEATAQPEVPTAAPDLSAIPAEKWAGMKFEDFRKLFPLGTPKAQISQAIAEAQYKEMHK